MNFEYFIARRIGATTRKSFSNIIMRIAIVAVALSIATMIIASSMVAGFKTTISEKVFGFWGHIHISNDYNHSNNSSGKVHNPIHTNQPYYPHLDTVRKIAYHYTGYKNDKESILEVNLNSGIQHIQLFAKREGIIKTKNQIEGIVLRGVDSDYRWDFMSQYIVEGDRLELKPDTVSKDIMISKSTAQRLELKLGNKLLVYFIQDGTTVARQFRIKGIYKTGLEDFDRRFALIDIRCIQKLNNWRPYKNYGNQLIINERGTPLAGSDLEEDLSGNQYKKLLRQYPVCLRGVTEGTQEIWDYLSGNMVEGERFDLGDSSTIEAVVPTTLAEERQASLGDTITIDYLDSPTDDVIALELVVAGIYNPPDVNVASRNPKIGKLLFERTIFVRWEYLNNINYKLAPQVSGFEIYIENIDLLDEIRDYIYIVELDQRGGDGYPYTIREVEPVILDWLEMTDTNETIILIIMVWVAIINMITSLMILILERTNMIGILKALGASNYSIRKLFLYNAAQIILWGLLIGNVFGIGFCYAQETYGLVRLPEDLYYVAKAPVEMSYFTIVLLNLGTLLITLLALLLPSWLVSRVDPVKAIQFK